jgi:xanthine/CO dehydrogenase XdhC/CoxF family maturation factor
VKQWKETAEILGRVRRLAEVGQRAALATVTHIRGSAYRRAGAKLLVAESGETAGGVSGGCLESDVRETGLAVLRDGVPRRLHYDTGDDENKVWGLGLGCSGSVDIFVQPAGLASGGDVVARALEMLEGDAAFSVSTIIRGEGREGGAAVCGSGGILASSTGDAGLDRELARHAAPHLAARESALHEVAGFGVFTEVLLPPPHVILFGAGDDAMPLCAYASDAGFRVCVVDHRQAFLSLERFPGASRLIHRRSEHGLEELPISPRTYAVVMTHSLSHDREWARRLLATDVPYIGVLGPRARTAEILQKIGAEGSGRVYGPVGLDVGAEGQEQIAVSILAELLAVHASREPSHLREKEGAIHAS